MNDLQYDLFTGRALKTAAMERMESREWVQEARRVAVGIARSRGRVRADDVRPHVPPAPHDNCWGAVFSKDTFYKGSSTQATRPEAHARWVHWWHLR
jgi:hypothetical protein